MKRALLALGVLCACGGAAVDARYPVREPGCPVRMFPGSPSMPVDELGSVTVQCSGGGGGACERQLLDTVCAKGGDVAWGTAANALTATTLTAHAAHSQRVTKGPREKGCAVQLLSQPFHTENIGPVTVLCSPDDSQDVCQRALLDEVCQLGGDAVWQLEGPAPEDTQNGPRQRMRGRAVHTK